MRLHWSPKSPCVRKVMVCVHELDLLDRIELVRSAAAMARPNPALMQDNPLSKIPTLVLDDGRVLFDSTVICEYLDDIAGGRLFPRHGPARWQALRWQAFGDGLTDVLILWRNERERALPLEALMRAFEAKVRASLGALDAEVPALRLAPFGIGQIALCCALGYIDYRFEALRWRDLAPALAGWQATVRQRGSIIATEPVEG